MKIRCKFLLVMLPLIVVTLSLAETASYFNAVNGVTRLARELLGFKLGELEKYADNQWSLLVENNYAGRPDMVEAAKKAVEIYGRSIVQSDTGAVFALDTAGSLVMAGPTPPLRAEEQGPLLDMLRAEKAGLQSAVIGGEKRVFQAFFFSPFQWYIIISEKSGVFYRDANRIAAQTAVTLGAAIILAAVLLILVTRHLTNPLGRVVKAMNNIIDSADLSFRLKL